MASNEMCALGSHRSRPITPAIDKLVFAFARDHTITVPHSLIVVWVRVTAKRQHLRSSVETPIQAASPPLQLFQKKARKQHIREGRKRIEHFFGGIGEETRMAAIEVSNTFLIGVIVAFVFVRLVCECTKDTHMRPRVPSDIHFTMNSIPNFVTTPEGTIGALADFVDQLLLHGDQLAMLVHPIRIVYARSKWWALDNRRLYALRLAEARGAVSTVRHMVVRLEDTQVQREFDQKLCTQTLGKTAIVHIDSGFRWGAEYELKEA